MPSRPLTHHPARRCAWATGPCFTYTHERPVSGQRAFGVFLWRKHKTYKNRSGSRLQGLKRSPWISSAAQPSQEL